MSVVLIALLLAIPGAAGANSGITPMVTTGGDHTCALNDRGQVRCWGLNASGQLGNGDLVNRPAPGLNTGLEKKAEMIAASAKSTCAALVDGSVACWGANDLGQLGHGSQDGSAHPSPSIVPNLKSVYWLVAGGDHFCAARWSGSLVCWGSNSDGQTGNGVVGGVVAAPNRVSGVKYVRALAAGAKFTCLTTEKKKTLCVGNNATGQRGAGSAGPSTGTLTGVAGLPKPYELQAGGDHVCALVYDKVDLNCWGSNLLGQLAQGTTGDAAVRGVTPIPQIKEVRALGGTASSSCALNEKRRVACWGDGSHGRLGVGSETSSGNPLPLGINNVATLSTGASSGTQCSIHRGGAVMCWGANSFGQAAASPPAPVLVPTVIPHLDLVSRPHYPDWSALSPINKLKRSKSGRAWVISTRLVISPSPFVYPSAACRGTVAARAYYLKKVRKRKKSRKSRSDKYTYKKIGVTKKAKLRRSGEYCTAKFRQVIPRRKFRRKKYARLSASSFGNRALAKFSTGEYKLRLRRGEPRKKKS